MNARTICERGHRVIRGLMAGTITPDVASIELDLLAGEADRLFAGEEWDSEPAGDSPEVGEILPVSVDENGLEWEGEEDEPEAQRVPVEIPGEIEPAYEPA